MECSNIDKFTEDFSAKFGKVLDSVQAYEEYCIVGKTEMPTFTGKVSYDHQAEYDKKLIYHQFIDTGDICKTKEEATLSLIEEIKRFAESVIPSGHDYKHYWLFWRFRPEIVYERDFDMMEDIYKGWARLSIVGDNGIL